MAPKMPEGGRPADRPRDRCGTEAGVPVGRPQRRQPALNRFLRTPRRNRSDRSCSISAFWEILIITVVALLVVGTGAPARARARNRTLRRQDAAFREQRALGHRAGTADRGTAEDAQGSGAGDSGTEEHDAGDRGDAARRPAGHRGDAARTISTTWRTPRRRQRNSTRRHAPATSTSAARTRRSRTNRGRWTASRGSSGCR
jgi:hypothetical protein